MWVVVMAVSTAYASRGLQANCAVPAKLSKYTLTPDIRKDAGL